jgi:hypothetical protein
MSRPTPAEYGAALAEQAPPLAKWQVQEAARILSAITRERMQRETEASKRPAQRG